MEAFFHHQTFRPSQEEIIRDVVSGQDVLAVVATDGGKSLCYHQLSAIMLNGMTIVISLLIALMQVQVCALSRQGVRMETLNSTQTYDERILIEMEIAAGTVRISKLCQNMR